MFHCPHLCLVLAHKCVLVYTYFLFLVCNFSPSKLLLQIRRRFFIAQKKKTNSANVYPNTSERKLHNGVFVLFLKQYIMTTLQPNFLISQATPAVQQQQQPMEIFYTITVIVSLVLAVVFAIVYGVIAILSAKFTIAVNRIALVVSICFTFVFICTFTIKRVAAQLQKLYTHLTINQSKNVYSIFFFTR